LGGITDSVPIRFAPVLGVARGALTPSKKPAKLAKARPNPI